MATLTTGRVEAGAVRLAAASRRRIGTAQDAAAAVAFFLSPDSSFCNGSVLLVDGGMRADLHSASVLNG